MDDSSNTLAGWILFGGIIALGATIMTGEYFHHEVVEKGGYEVADSSPSEGGGAAAAKPTDFSKGDPAKGAEVFKKCASCHTITPGGANGQGPNLHGVMGRAKASVAGFAYSGDLTKLGGAWDWVSLDLWLLSPKKMAAATKMSFAGLSKPEDRADLIVYLNAQGGGKPIPAAPVEAAPAAAAAENAAAPAAEPAKK
jgi:cytochrome c